MPHGLTVSPYYSVILQTTGTVQNEAGTVRITRLRSAPVSLSERPPPRRCGDHLKGWSLMTQATITGGSGLSRRHSDKTSRSTLFARWRLPRTANAEKHFLVPSRSSIQACVFLACVLVRAKGKRVFYPQDVVRQRGLRKVRRRAPLSPAPYGRGEGFRSARPSRSSRHSSHQERKSPRLESF